MEIVLDSLGVFLLSGILLAALIHLVVLRKPEPAAHPLLLGRQSELARVRKKNESPAFISATAGLGGHAKQLLRSNKDIAEAWHGHGTRILLGMMNASEADLSSTVLAMKDVLKPVASKPLTIKLDDPTDALVTILAATLLPDSPEPPLLAASWQALEKAQSPLLISPPDALNLGGTRLQADSRELFIVNSSRPGPQSPQVTTVPGCDATNVYLSELPQAKTAGEVKSAHREELARTQINSDCVDGTVTITHKNLMQGGLVSVLTMFPAGDRPSASDRILSFEDTSKPYGLAVALACSATGATLRLCTASKGIVSKCRTFGPSIIFCTPNELNAIRAAIRQFLPKGGAIVPLAQAIKRSLLRAGSVSRSTFWDSLMFGKISAGVVGPNLRCIVVSAEEGWGPSNECLEFLRIFLGVPIVVALSHPLVAGPVTHTLYHDYQSFADQGKYSHVGAPSATVECKLVDLSEDDIQAGMYKGELVVKGPSVLTNVQSQSAASLQTTDGWTRLRVNVELRKNGTLRVIKSL